MRLVRSSRDPCDCGEAGCGCGCGCAGPGSIQKVLSIRPSSTFGVVLAAPARGRAASPTYTAPGKPRGFTLLLPAGPQIPDPAGSRRIPGGENILPLSNRVERAGPPPFRGPACTWVSLAGGGRMPAPP
jgi:hypothetical protein